MKKIYVLICLIFIILLVGCNNKTVHTEGTNEFDKIKSELQPIPQKYNTDNAIKNSYFVILNEKIKSKNEFDKIKSELQLIPQKYNTDNAVKDGCFVILKEEVKSKIEIIDKFVYDSQNEKSSSITIANYSTDGKPTITKILYNGIKYYAIADDTRVTDKNTDYHEFESKYLKVFQENNHKEYLLLNDKKINYDQYIKSKLSSNSKDEIYAQFLCSYK